MDKEKVIGVDGKPTNARHRNLFAEEVVVTEKERMRKELLTNKNEMMEVIKTMTPTDIFMLFDEDDSGLISFEEFRKLLPFLNVNISDAKAYRYFRMCDTDGSGEIDVDEFKVALFTCDPTSGNPVGFQPASFVTPMGGSSALQEVAAEYPRREEVGSEGRVQFNSDPHRNIETKAFTFEFFDRELWKDRVRPQQLIDRLRLERMAAEQEEKRDADRNVSGLGALGEILKDTKIVIDPYLKALDSPFAGLNVQLNTAALWGRRIYQVAVSEGVIFALADTGEWWHEIQPDSVELQHWRGDVTARSQLLMGVKGKSLPPDKSMEKLTEEEFKKLSPEDRKAECVKIVAKYFSVWKPPPNLAMRDIHIDKDILPTIRYDEVKFALQCRGKLKQNEELTKLQMVDLLHDDIVLEKKVLGERAHKAIKEIESQVQAEEQAEELTKSLAISNEAQRKANSNYTDWRKRVTAKREAAFPEDEDYTPRGQSIQIPLIGATPRGPDIVTPRGFQAALQITAGTAHACLIHKSGELYTWGIGGAGRLGVDLTLGDPQGDAQRPTLVQALMQRPVVRVSCGYSHTGCIVAGGELYMWGSTTNGKCGFGPVVNTQECYASVPTRVIVGAEDRRIKKISCGAMHTGVITEAGHLFLFGCGDGGRLGLGAGRYESHYTPVYVNIPGLNGEKLSTVSCGNTTTFVCTEISREYDGADDDVQSQRHISGGRVFMAGTTNVLGRQCDAFTLLTGFVYSTSTGNEAKQLVPIKQVSAGYMHTALVSAEGELFCFGYNVGGCCGLPSSHNFVSQPTSVKFLYNCPSNIAIGKKAYQSTTFNSREASFAVNGRIDGNGVNKCSCTQQESQPWLEIDLGRTAIIESVVIWNRTDVPRDKNLPADQYTKVLFPCWVMVGKDRFQPAANAIALKESLRAATCKARFTDDKRSSTWRCPANTQGRFIRVQLETYNSLSLAEVEVFGYWGLAKGVGRVSYATAGRDVTVAVVRPNTDPKDLEELYKRAAYSDSMNADILRQLETYTLEYDKFGRGEILQEAAKKKSCCICSRGLNQDRCESCILYNTYETALKAMPPAIGGRRRRLRSMSDFLLQVNKPELEVKEVPKARRPTKWQMRKKYFYDTITLKTLFSTKKGGYVPPQEAMQADPNEIMQNLQRMDKIDDKKLSTLLDNQGSKDGVAVLGDASISGVMILSNNNEDESVAPESIGDSVVPARRIFGGKRHGYGQNAPIKVGDVLPTGHTVKPAIPKSIAEEVEDSDGFKAMMRDQRKHLKQMRKSERRKTKIASEN
eukprot:gene23212-31534_t